MDLEVSVRRHGKRHVYLSLKYPLRDEAGRIFAVAGICTDITRQKRAEEQAHRALEQRDRFLAMLSHELRNPLAAVQNAVYVLEQTLPGAAADGAAGQSAGKGLESPKPLEIILRQSRQMGRLLDDLLDISRVTQGKIDLRKQVFDLRQAAQDAVMAVRPNAEARGLDFAAQMPDEPLPVEGDAARLQQVQVNLLVNAVKYTSTGSVHFSLERVKNHAVIRVRDTGMGMTKGFQQRLFQPFAQADETLNRADGGMGVGLTLARRLVEMHGGAITAHSEGRNRGSEFVVRLPLSRQPAETDDQSVRPDAQVAPDVSGVKVLVVEDNADTRDMLRTLLDTYGYQVSDAGDGRAAVAAIERERPDVALIDIGLPELSGYDVARRVRKGPATDTYLVALTGYGRPSDRRKALACGFDDHMTKPVSIEALRALFHQVATRHRASRGPVK
jgi:two-component system CheB/CheR fusion protein